MNGFHSNQGASTSSGQFPPHYNPSQNVTPSENNMPIRGPPIPQRHQGMPQNSWSQVPLNSQSMSHMHEGQFTTQQQWINQPNQAFQNGMSSGMNTFNTAYLPPNIVQDAIALSTPVESSDEPVLVQHILNGLRRAETYKEILNSLHGKNGHSASLWKDYYLDHKSRLDSWVNMCLQKEKSNEAATSGPKRRDRAGIPSIKKPMIKKPSPALFKVEHSPGLIPLTPSTAPVKRSLPKTSPRHTPTGALTQVNNAGRRATINSLTAPAPVFDSRLPPPHADIKIPEPPSRSPTPPTKVIPQGRGNKYTAEDREFFIKFLQRQLQKTPNLNRNELCELMAEKAPHHTAQSWASHWSINHDLPDKIFAAARGKEYAQTGEFEGESDEETKQQSRRKRPKYRDPSTSDEEAEGGKSEEEDETPSVSDDDDESDDEKPLKRFNASEMGQKGGPFTEADMYMAAKHIAGFPNWEGTTSKDRWAPFAQKYPQRSAKSWAEYLRRSEKEISRLVKRIRKERSLQTQRVRPARSPPRKRQVAKDEESS